MRGALAACLAEPPRAYLLAPLPAGLALGCVGEPAPPPPPAPAPAASLSGRLRAEGEPLSPDDLARSLVYLEPVAAPAGGPPASVELHHHSARLAPDLLA